MTAPGRKQTTGCCHRLLAARAPVVHEENDESLGYPRCLSIAVLAGGDNQGYTPQSLAHPPQIAFLKMLT